MGIEVVLPSGRRFETVMNALPKIGDEISVNEGDFVIADVIFTSRDDLMYITVKLEAPKVDAPTSA